MAQSSRAKQSQSSSAPPYHPNNKQREFHVHPAKYRGFIGGFGSGKSVAGAMEAWKHIMIYPGSFGMIGRLQYTALSQSSMRTFFQWGPTRGWKLNQQEHKLYVPVKGKVSEVLFWHLDDPDPLRSMEFDWFWIDEAHEVPEDVFLMLKSRLRGKVGPHRGWLTTNPHGHDYMWRWFIDQSHIPSNEQKDYFGIVARSEDNIANLPEGYVERLRATYPEEWVRRFLDSSFDVFEGQIYPEFGKDHVIDSYDIPKEWPRIRAMDVGYTNPTVVLWLAIDPDGRLVVYDEYYQSAATPQDIVYQIKQRDGLAPWPTYIDPAAAQRTAASSISVMQQYIELGLRVRPAKNAVWPGILAVKQRMKRASDGFPRLFVFRECEQLIREMKAYRWKRRTLGAEDINEPEQPHQKDDHGPDALRYACMSLPMSEEAELRRTRSDWQPPRRTVRSRVVGY